MTREKIVVTGGAGFIGGHIAEEGLARGYAVTILDNLSSGNRSNLPPGAEFLEGDIQDPELLTKAFKGAKTVFHLGALISVPESMADKKRYMAVNTVGAVDVLDVAVKSGVENFVFSSSAAVYGDNPISPKTEDLVPEPLSPYAINKLDGEYLAEIYHREFGINAVSLRYFNVFGPRQSPRSAYAAAVPIFMEKALQNEPIKIYGDGEQTRDFVYVKDIVQANFLAAAYQPKPLDHNEEGVSRGTYDRVFNVASGEITTINNLVKLIIKTTGSRSEIIYLPERPGDIKHSRGDNQKIRKILGFEPKFTLESGLLEMGRPSSF
jgi:UDP-glucose 4-epimerase